MQVPLSGGGSAAASVATSDGQAGVTLNAGAVAAHPPDTGVRVTFTPLNRATLGLLPPGLRPESNAYKVTLTYVPSGSPVVAMNGFGTIALTAAGPASALVSSCDGVTRAGTAAGPFGDSHGRLAGLADPGY